MALCMERTGIVKVFASRNTHYQLYLIAILRQLTSPDSGWVRMSATALKMMDREETTKRPPNQTQAVSSFASRPLTA